MTLEHTEIFGRTNPRRPGPDHHSRRQDDERKQDNLFCGRSCWNSRLSADVHPSLNNIKKRPWVGGWKQQLYRVAAQYPEQSGHPSRIHERQQQHRNKQANCPLCATRAELSKNTESTQPTGAIPRSCICADSARATFLKTHNGESSQKVNRVLETARDILQHLTRARVTTTSQMCVWNTTGHPQKLKRARET